MQELGGKRRHDNESGAAARWPPDLILAALLSPPTLLGLSRTRARTLPLSLSLAFSLVRAPSLSCTRFRFRSLDWWLCLSPFLFLKLTEGDKLTLLVRILVQGNAVKVSQGGDMQAGMASPVSHSATGENNEFHFVYLLCWS